MKMFGSQPFEDIPADLATLIRIGTIVSVDLAEARCVVRYGDPDDEDAGETPPIRWLAPRAGLTRIWSPPSVGEQVMLLSPDGQVGAAIALTGIVQDAFPPLGSTAQEMIEFADGARVTYDPEAGALAAVLPAGATAEIDAPGGITLRGDVTIEGKLSVSETIDADDTITSAQDVVGDGISLKNHLHGGVSSGSAKTAKPE